MAIRALPNVTPGSDFYATMKSWQQILAPVLATKNPPSVVMSLSAKGVSGGILLSWSLMTQNSGVDGYVIQSANSGDFSANYAEIPIPNGQQTSYLDAQATGTVKYYRLIATTGTLSSPQQSRSNPTGVISATAGSGSTTFDTSQTGNPAKSFRGSLFPIAPKSRLNLFNPNQ